eukprot:TRINITY_DN1032_c0_g1_i2.p1 TRINITY_DN1032_c0_g1~~TRINITY_DN1032_c0_g1_i2.p1  ORF type:complete len:174 (+),score=32.11 TRINITY_DN1032_c0_g1_i2:350-871(+)
MSMGAHRSIHVEINDDLQPLAVAKILQKLVEKENPGLVILGKQAIDGDNCQTGQLLGALLDWPQVTFASKIELDNSTASITREVDGGLQTLAVELPAVITTDLRLNQPRYSKLKDIMKARNLPIEVTTPAALGVDVKPRYETISVEDPPVRSSGIKVNSVQELVQKLKSSGVI